MAPYEQPAPESFVLVVDADSESRSRVIELLRRAGYPAAVAASGQQALEEVQRKRPALVILDVDLPDSSGYEIYRELRDKFGESLKIMVVSTRRGHDSNDEVVALLLGADDYVAKPFVPDVLLARLRRLARSSPAMSATDGFELTPRELEVMNLLADGRQEAEIASDLYISRKTVAKHIEHILAKLGVHSRAQAVALAARDDTFNARPPSARGV